MEEDRKECRTDLGCPKCSYSTPSLYELKQHIKKHAANLVELYCLMDLSLLTRGINGNLLG
jgi:hypothetical protein